MSKLNVPVEEFTTPDPKTADENMLIDDVRQMMDEMGIRHLPITRGDTVVGVISDRDVRVLSGLSAEQRALVRAGDIMAADLVTVTVSMPLDRVAYIMSDKKVGSVIVMGDDDKFFGIFTVTDALNALIEIVRGD
ncbi:MAG: CBS domain-containing protein [Thiohalomonadaceae bacterium]|jgi:acetoin utilization protein AcuB